MGSFYTDLKDTFAKQLEATKQLIQISQEKTTAIKQNDITQIMNLTNKEEQFAREMIMLEKNRDYLIKTYEKENNTKIQNLSKLLENMDASMSVGINFVAEELKYNLEILKEHNNINNTLMSFILEQIEIANNLIQGDRVPSTYENTKFNKKNYNNQKMDTSYFDSKY